MTNFGSFYSRQDGFLRASHLKLDRAKRHRSDLEKVIGSYIDSDPYRVIVEDDAHSKNKLIKLVGVVPVPADEISLITGDCLNNLKAALDYAALTSMRAAGLGVGTNVPIRRIFFPSGKDRVSFEANCKGIFKGGCNEYDHWLLTRMKMFEVFPEGCGRLLYLLKELNNLDKHNSLVVTSRAGSPPNVSVIFPDGHASRLFSSTFVGNGDFVLATVPPGGTYEIDSNDRVRVQIFLAGVLRHDLIQLLQLMERDVLYHLHVIETLLEASPNILIPMPPS